MSIALILALYISIYILWYAISGDFDERLIPTTVMGIGAILYFFGLIGWLLAGAYIVIAAGVILWLLIFVLWVKKKRLLHLSNLRYESVLFIVSGIAFGVLYKDMVACHWDEFSHWADVVKGMVHVDDIPTNTMTLSEFPSYPPAMPLMQYLCEKVILFFNADKVFDESMLFFMHRIYCLSLLIPLLNFVKDVLGKISMSIMIFIMPTLFYSVYYNSLYIDPFVAILAISGFAMVLYHDKDDTTYDIYINLLCFTLVLAKDVGIYFAIFIAVAYAIARFVGKGDRGFSRRLIAIPFLSILLAKATWEINLKLHNTVTIFKQRMYLRYYLKLMLFHTDDTYRQEVVDSCRNAIFTKGISVGGVTVSYFSLLVISFFVLFITIIIWEKYEELSRVRKCLILFLPMIQAIIYILSIGAMYAFRFSENEALELASYERYVNMSFMCLVMVSILGLYRVISYSRMDAKMYKALFILLSCLTLIISPMNTINHFVCGDDARTAKDTRSKYESLSSIIAKTCSGGDKIYFISRGDSGYDYWVSRFNARPNLMHCDYGGWNLGKPVNNDDIRYRNIAPTEWMDKLIDEHYDYVAIYNTGDDFAWNYESCFEDKGEVVNNSLFILDKERRVLKRV